MKIVVDVFSDVICPWCYIGKRRLEKAIAAGDGPVSVQWHPFQLNPAMPKQGISRKDYRTRKFGSWERSKELDERVVAVGESEDIHFQFDIMERTPNTVDAHRLIGLADQYDRQDAVVESLFQAYFTEGRDIGNLQTLVDLAAEAGLNRQLAESMLNSEVGLDHIAQAGRRLRQSQVEGVPLYIINDAISIAGAQPPEAFVDVFRQVRS